MKFCMHHLEMCMQVFEVNEKIYFFNLLTYVGCFQNIYKFQK